MSDEIFVSEKTGKRYKLFMQGAYQGYAAIEEIFEPKLEENDWVLSEKFCSPKILNEDNIKRWQEEFNSILEIRKSNGEVWRKIYEEWQLTPRDEKDE